MLRDGTSLGKNASKKSKDKWFVSPLIEYAAHPWYSKITSFTLKNGETRYAQVVLAMKVRKGTYEKQGETEGGAKVKFDDYKCINEKEVEWLSNRRGCVYPYGLLIRVFDEMKNSEIRKADYNKAKE